MAEEACSEVDTSLTYGEEEEFPEEDPALKRNDSSTRRKSKRTSRLLEADSSDGTPFGIHEKK